MTRYRKQAAIGITAGVVALSLVATSCSSQQGMGVSRNAAADDLQANSTMTLPALPALPSDAPAVEFAAGGGGLSGGEWTVPGMPGALGPKDEGLTVASAQQAQVGGVRVRLTWLANGKPTSFVVHNALDDSTVWDSSKNQSACVNDAKANECSVPAGVLAVGSSYTVDVTNDNITQQRLFTVVDTSATSGSVNTGLYGREVKNGNGDFQLGLSFSSAEQGATASTKTTTDLSGGLPPGWSWTGIPGSVARAVVSDAHGYQGFTKLLTIEMGAATTILGCSDSGSDAPDPCAMMSGSAPGYSLSATLPKNSVRAAIVTDQMSGSNWSFDDQGRPTEFATPGNTPVALSYRGDTDQLSSIDFDDVTWNVYYGGDRQCSGDTPPGFISNPGDYACVVSDSLGNWMRIMYTQPQGAANPRISRIMGLPASCDFDYDSCNPLLAQVTDYGWDSHNRMTYTRDSAGTSGILSGVLTRNDDPKQDLSVGWTEYDSLGRIAKAVQPSPDASLSREEITHTYAEYGDVPKSLAPATRLVTSTRSAQDDSVAESVAKYAYDDRSRGLELQQDGVDTTYVWGKYKNLQYATVSNGQVQSDTYDNQNRQVGQYTGSVSDFDLTECSSNNAKISGDSCKPKDLSKVSYQTTEYDQPDRVAPGLTGFWYDSSNFSGTPVAVNALNSVEPQDSAAGFPLDLPSGVSKDWAVRMVGGVHLDDHQYGYTVNTGSSDIEGSLWINGQYCAAIVDGSGSCNYDNTAANPTAFVGNVPIRLDLTTQGSDAKVVSIILQDYATGDQTALTNTQTRQRTNAVTQTDYYDPTPNGKKFASGSVASYYEDPASQDATKVVSSGTSPSGKKLELPAVTSTYEAGPNGADRLAAQTNSAGETTTFQYWGDDETPSGMGNSNEIPDNVRGVAQRNQVKSVTDPTGRVSTFAYDAYGAQQCIAYSNEDNGKDGQWTCTQRDEMGRRLQVTQRSNADSGDAGSGDIVTNFSYAFGTKPGDALMTTTATTTTGGKDPKTEITATSVADVLLGYTDTLGTNTKYTYNAAGQTVEQKITPASYSNVAAPATTLSFGYNSQGNQTSVSVDGKTAAKVKYDQASDRLQRIASIEYGNGVGLTNQYSDAGGLSAQKWKLADGSDFDVTQTSTLSGYLLDENFGGTKNTFDYDGQMRLLNASVNGKDYTYGWDTTNRRTCAAVAIANPSDAACDKVAGHFDYSYSNQRMVSNTDPNAAIPSGDNAYDADGRMTSVGNVALTYDAAGHITGANRADGTGAQYVRDTSGRVISTSVETKGDDKTPTPQPSDSSSAQPTATTSSQPAQDTAESSSPSASVSSTTPAASVQPTRAAGAEEPKAGIETSSTALGYSGPDGDPSVLYTKDGPQLILSLPGGAVMIGSAMQITSPSSTGVLTLNPAASKPKQVSFKGPFGESQSATPVADQPVTDLFVSSGDRSVSTQLAQFTSSDPSVFAGGSQYAYTPGDPINYSDPSGHLFDRKRHGVGAGWQVLISLGMSILSTAVMSAGLDSLINRFKWMSVNGGLQKVAVYAMYMIGNTAMTVLGSAFATNFHLGEVSSFSWLFNSLTNTISSVIGFIVWRSKVTVNAVMSQLEDAVAGVQATVETVGEKATVFVTEQTTQIVASGEKTMAALTEKAEEALTIARETAATVSARVDETIETVGATATIAGGAVVGGIVGNYVSAVTGIPGLTHLGMVAGAGVAKLWSYRGTLVNAYKNMEAAVIERLAPVIARPDMARSQAGWATAGIPGPAKGRKQAKAAKARSAKASKAAKTEQHKVDNGAGGGQEVAGESAKGGSP